MKYKFGKTVVIALGGSIIYPDQIDVLFLKQFREFILKRLKRSSPSEGRGSPRRGGRFVIVAGGGRIARVYQEAASKIAKITDDDKDWLGIHATRANAHLLRTVFRDVADAVVIDERYKIKKLRHPVTIGAGWRPGQSTDHSAVALAVDFKIPDVIIAGRPSFVYDKDHQKYANAKPLPELSWSAYQRLIPRKWKPGLHTPVDPVAAKLAEQKKIKAIIVNGKDLKNFSNLLSGKDFKGTLIN